MLLYTLKLVIVTFQLLLLTLPLTVPVCVRVPDVPCGAPLPTMLRSAKTDESVPLLCSCPSPLNWGASF
jgi:hypothetical protein